MSAVQLATEAATTVTAGGFIDLGNDKLAELEVLFRGLSVVAGIGFVIFQAISSRGAIARIIVAGLAAGLFIWIVWNVSDLETMVDDEINAGSTFELQQPTTTFRSPQSAVTDTLSLLSAARAGQSTLGEPAAT